MDFSCFSLSSDVLFGLFFGLAVAAFGLVLASNRHASDADFLGCQRSPRVYNHGVGVVRNARRMWKLHGVKHAVSAQTLPFFWAILW